ncbi:uncharacterized protein Ogg1 [Halyomorpha halys]|uniref:uncharacterized protein Ogg1 n=1 Tax=Halyomorpha halys TaxID=286706 RepID=UPI0006D4FF05|nr:uncharacterized protein LOC106679502 [Halyomorpha halys]
MISGKILAKRCSLNLKMMLEGGQCFRWKETNKNEWTGVVLNVVWTLRQFEEYLEYTARSEKSKINGKIDCFNTDVPTCNIDFVKDKLEDFIRSYLRLEEPLEEYYNDWGKKDTKFNSIAEKCYGIRILNQHPVENLFSFICSSNNNIIRISSMVEKLCSLYGTFLCTHDGKEYFSFPEISKLTGEDVDAALRKAGFGYRAKFIQQSAKMLESLGGLEWLLKLKECSYKEAKAELIKLPGIGPKVADCICLMSLGHMEALPVDTHVFQIASHGYMPHLKSVKNVTDKIYNEIGDYFRKLYGPLAGWAHTVLFCGDLRTFKNAVEPAQKHKSSVKRDLDSELVSVSGTLHYSRNDLNLKTTFVSGQTYRFKEIEPDIWRGVFAGKIWTFKQLDTHIDYTSAFPKPSSSIHSKKRKSDNANMLASDEKQCEDILKDYFRLDFPLQEHYKRWSDQDDHFKSISKNFCGMRMIKQDIVENLFAFICSSNNTISRMTTMVEAMCSLYGKKIGELDHTIFYDFPPVYKLAEKSVLDDLVKANFGFRAKYVHNSAKYIAANGGDSWFKNLQALPYEEAKVELMKLPGIADKIADCICLTALDHLETIPVDTHVFKIAKTYYLPHLQNKKTVSKESYKEIGECFRKTFCPYAGWAHTVLFCSDLKQNGYLMAS